jgi:hypothetical protein
MINVQQTFDISKRIMQFIIFSFESTNCHASYRHVHGARQPELRETYTDVRHSISYTHLFKNVNFIYATLHSSFISIGSSSRSILEMWHYFIEQGIPMR